MSIGSIEFASSTSSLHPFRSFAHQSMYWDAKQSQEQSREHREKERRTARRTVGHIPGDGCDRDKIVFALDIQSVCRSVCGKEI